MSTRHTCMGIKRKFENIVGRFLLTGNIKINCADGMKSVFYAFGKSFLKKDKWTNIEPPFFLKINRDADYTISCIQGWLDVAYEMKREIAFVCDNKLLEYKVLTKCKFYDKSQITFISSMGKELDGVVDNLCSGNWANATHAHLTPFYISKKNGIKKFWNIDADDTTIAMTPDKISNLLHVIEEKSEKEKIEAFSLDMHNSKSFGVNWTLGVLFINDISGFCNLFENVNDLSWGDWIIKDYDDYLNLDWFMTTLQRKNEVNIKSFYIDDCFFIHWGDFLRNTLNCGVYFWHNEKLYFPLVCLLYGNKSMGVLDAKNSIKINVNYSLKESIEYFREYLIRGDIKSNRAFKTLSKGDEYWDAPLDLSVVESCFQSEKRSSVE